MLNARGEFHGYAGRDFYKVDPHWGALGDLQHLVRAAHERGILVIDDVVVNHGGDLVDSADAGYPGFRPPPDGYAGPPIAFDAEASYIGNVFSVGPQLRDDPMFRSAAA